MTTKTSAVTAVALIQAEQEKLAGLARALEQSDPAVAIAMFENLAKLLASGAENLGRAILLIHVEHEEERRKATKKGEA